MWVKNFKSVSVSPKKIELGHTVTECLEVLKQTRLHGLSELQGFQYLPAWAQERDVQDFLEWTVVGREQHDLSRLKLELRLQDNPLDFDLDTMLVSIALSSETQASRKAFHGHELSTWGHVEPVGGMSSERRGPQLAPPRPAPYQL